LFYRQGPNLILQQEIFLKFLVSCITVEFDVGAVSIKRRLGFVRDSKYLSATAVRLEYGWQLRAMDDVRIERMMWKKQNQTESTMESLIH